ncbi:MAG: sulfatase [Planctomycetota bacterium]|nr:MAG: sulfatase [Planctomycetota bacterium]
MNKIKKPNILFIITDQQRHDVMGCCDDIIQTPNLDKLASRGKIFTEAVCNVPMCVASRYAIMTGLYGFQSGVKHNAQMICRDEDLPVPVLAERLRSAGYKTAGFGKTHWYIGSSILPKAEIDGSARGFDTRYIRGASGNPSTEEKNAIYMGDEEPEWVIKEKEENSTFGLGGETVNGYVGLTSTVPPEHHGEGWLTRKALDYIDNELDRDNPFFMYLSYDYPHVGLRVPPGYEERYNINDFSDEPPVESATLGHRQGEDFKDAWLHMTSKERQKSRLRYAALCTYVDDLYGSVIQKLDDIGELENTFILYTSDHGDMMGDRGLASKYSLYEGSIRVPMIIAGPGVESTGLTDERPAESVDIVPTLLDAAGVEIPENLPGFSLISDFKRSGAFAEMHGRGYEEYQRAPAIMYRNKDWKLILYISGPLGAFSGELENIKGELYYLKEDLIELNDLYKDDEHSKTREKMTTQLLMHVMCSLGRFPSGVQRASINVTGPETKPDSSIWE